MEQPMKKLVLFFVTLLTMATSAFAQIGSASSDLVFTPITPCRIVDTRFAPAGPVLAGSTRVFKAWAATYTAQGGSGTNCNILQSNDVAALALNLLVIVPSGEGFIKAWPVGVAQPNASTLNYKTNDVLANSATLKVSQVSGDWNLFSVSTTHFAADVVGYYSKPVATALECVNTALNVVSIAASSTNYVNSSACPVGYFAVSSTCDSGGVPGIYSGGSGMLGNTPAIGVAYCSYKNTTGAAISTSTAATCCRIPGR
jgi:hypothetical protein